MPNLLGLSIDVNGIGWALLDQQSLQIKAMGSRVFPVGCENFGSGKRELSKKAHKRFKRTTRYRYQRSRKRKIKVLEILIENNMCPLSKEGLHEWKENKKYPLNELAEWFSINPYHLRRKAVMESITPFELGRILYQISIHRGFPVSERNRGLKENAMYVGLPQMDRRGINHTQDNIENSSLGVYLNHLLPQENVSYQYSNERVRNRFLSREMYQNELDNIWTFQHQFHDFLTLELKEKLIGNEEEVSPNKGAVFFQRPLKSQKFRVGRCEFEPTKTKCCVSSLVYQQVLAYRWVNSLKVNGVSLNESDRNLAVDFFMTHRRFDFGRVKRIFQNPEGNYSIKDEELIKGSFVNASLSHYSIFGDEWFDFSEKDQEDIWHALYFFDNKEKLKSYVMDRWYLGEERASKFSELQLDKNYAPISKKAARNILYFLKRGIPYDLSVVLAGVKNSLGVSWDNIAESDINFMINRVLTLYKENKVQGFIPNLKHFLEDEMQFSSIQIKKLYGQFNVKEVKLQSKFQVDKKTDKEITNLKSPLLVNAVFQLRKILNDLIDAYGPIEEIKAELSADLKVNKFQRYLYRLDQKRQQRLRSKYIALLGERKENITPMNLTKYELWEECKQTCPYTGAHISLDELFTEAIQVVYIQPWKFSLNDSSWNKTLCLKTFTENILEKSPHEFFTTNAQMDWDFVVKRAARLFSNTKDFPAGYRKFKRFVKKYNHRDPLKHQMVDSNMFSKEVMCFLSKVVPNVTVAPGHVSEHFIEKWRLHQLFDSDVFENPQKDFRYRALLAFINANRTKAYLELLAEDNKYITLKTKKVFPEPYTGFRDDLEYQLHSILVSHKKENRLMTSRRHKIKAGEKHFSNYCVSVRGSLHKESVYGKRKPQNEQEEGYHIRKPLEYIQTEKQILKIVDPVVRNSVLEAVMNAGGFQSDAVPKNAFFSTNSSGYKVPKVFLPNKQGDPVPIKKVRIRETLTGAVQLKTNLNQHVNLRNNHHVLIYLDQQDTYQEQVISFWEAVRRKSSNEAVYQLPPDGALFVTTLEINDLFIMGVENPSVDLTQESNSFIAKHLYRVQKLSSKFYEFRLVHDNQINETESPNYIRINNFGERKTGWLTHNPIKVWMNSIGKLEYKDEFNLFDKAQKTYV